MRIDRRALLLGVGAAGGLVVAWALTPRHFAPPLPAGADEVAFDAWLKIGKDGVISVAVPQLEMGQGVSTLLPQIVAMELGADWRQIAVETAPISGAYANAALAARWSALWMPAFPGLADDGAGTLARRWAEVGDFVATADGLTLDAFEAPARIAAASARALLAKAAAKRWGVAWEECDAQNGFVLHGNRRLSFAQLAEPASGLTPPNPPVLRATPPGEKAAENPPGAPLRFPRLDLPAKVDGSATFAGDVRLPGMVFAAIRHGPMGDARLARFDAGGARGTPGFLKLVKGGGWLAAVGETWWAAERALTAIDPAFTVGERAEDAAIDRALDNALRRGKANRVAVTGDPETMLAGNFDLVAHYRVRPALHAGLETANATARLTGGRLEIWVASQAPGALRRDCAAALGLSPRDVIVYPVPAGGSFDARLEHPHAVEAALIARDVGRPVQLTWSRWQEHLAGLPRAPVAAVLAARTAEDGTVAAWKARIACPSSTAEFGRRLFGGERPWAARTAQTVADPLAVEGAVPSYALEHLIVEHVPTALPLATGRMRCNAPGYTAFFTESFVDELAHRSGREPLSYRMALLGSDVKLAACLQQAATLAAWNGGAGGQGLACFALTRGASAGRIAAVASARRDASGIRVDKITAVADIGRIVNVDIARQQIEGGLIFGLGLATGSATGYRNGFPTRGRLGLLGLPLLADAPSVEVDFIDSEEPPFDPGELGVAVAAPAIANALFAATGVRLRTLPLSEGT